MMLRGSLDPEYSLAHLGDIQVNLHNSFLAPKELDQNREISLEAFAHHRPVRKQEHILRRLLGDSASTPAALAAFIFLPRLLYRLPVEAAVLVKRLSSLAITARAISGEILLYGTQVLRI